MYAFCPKCGTVVKDHGYGQDLICIKCGAKVPSKSKPEKIVEIEQAESQRLIPSDKDSESYYYQMSGEPFIKPEDHRGARSQLDATSKTRGKAKLQPPSAYGYQRLPPPPTHGPPLTIGIFFKVILSFFTLLGLIAFAVMYFLNVISLGPAMVLVIPEMMVYSPAISVPAIIPPFFFTITYIPNGLLAVLYFTFIVTAILLSIYWLFYTEGHEAWDLLKKSASRFQAPPFNSRNSFFLLPQVFLALLFFNMVVIVIAMIIGVTPKTPESLGEETPLWYLMYSLAKASVWEELATRVLFIGIPLACFELIRRYATGKKRTEMANFIVGGKMQIGYAEGFFILFSSLTFGVAHIPGWGLWKFFPTFLTGLVFGYLFIVKGLHVAILLHFAFDYLTIPLDLFNYGLGEQILFGLALYFFLFLGMFFFMFYSYEFGNYIVQKFKTAQGKTQIST
jgi:hypothetical protein